MHNGIDMIFSKVVLARGELASFRLRGRACRVACVTGSLWLTVSGSQEDTVLHAGEEATLAGRGLVVVEALRTATMRLTVSSSAAGAWARTGGALNGILPAMSK